MKRIIYIQITFIISFLFLCPAISICLEQEIVLGHDDNWKDFISFTNIIKKEGKWGALDLTLDDAEGRVAATTDLLIHFNSKNLFDEAGNYHITGKKIMVYEDNAVFGIGSGLFERDKYTIFLSPGKHSLFSAGTLWGDFTLQFWMNPLTLSDSERILSWTGSRLSGTNFLNQSIQCTFSGRTCKWEFKNFFLSPGRNNTIIELTGLTPLLPRTWHHHMIRFDSTSGLLEYLVDGMPEAIRYTTEGQRDGGSIYLPYIGEILSGELRIGEYFTGLIDELSIVREYIDTPVRAKYSEIKGKGTSRIFDTKHTGSLLKRISAVYTVPEQTEIYFYYRIADHQYLSYDLGSEWIQFQPGETFSEQARGRYIQLQVELFPDGDQSIAPSISGITVTYEPDLPPPPPPDVMAVPGNQKVTLYWKKVNHRDVAGYEIYYGERPGYYYGRESAGGESPINAGNATEFEIKGLENGKIYYFAVIAYDSSEIPHKSIFSKEVFARPSGLLK